MASIALFLTCSFLFFSSFFGNYPQGVRDAVTTYSYWTRTGMTQHTAPWYTYGLWLLREEAPIFILAAIGTVVALVRRRSRFAVFAGIWAFVLLAAYSLIPYKTPWILLNIIVPMSIASGAGIQVLRDLLRGASRRKTSSSLSGRSVRGRPGNLLLSIGTTQLLPL